jgi:hypothetical protein
MQKTILLSTILLTILMFGFSSSTPVQATVTWNVQTVDENGAYGGHCPIVVDSNNTVHIAYSAIYNDTYWVMYATWNGSGFSIETVTKGDDAYSLVYDAENNPQILYGNWIYNAYPVGQTHSLSIASWNGKNWETQNAIITSADYGTLVLDSYGNPHIAYIIGNDLKYAIRTGTTWNIQTVDAIPEDPGLATFEVSLALDANNTPYLLYSPSSSEYNQTGMWSQTIKLAIYQNSGWDIQTLPLPELTVNYGNIILDSKGFPHFVCTQYSIKLENGSELTKLLYASWDGTTWNTETIGWTYFLPTSIGQLTLDSKGNPAFCFDGYREGLSYGSYSNGTWSIQTLNITVLGPCYLAFDSTDTPHISYSYRAGGNNLFAPVEYAMPTEIQNDSPSNPENNMLVLVATVAAMVSITAIVIVCMRRSNAK